MSLDDMLRHHCGEPGCDECEARRMAREEIARLTAEVARLKDEIFASFSAGVTVGYRNGPAENIVKAAFAEWNDRNTAFAMAVDAANKGDAARRDAAGLEERAETAERERDEARAEVDRLTDCMERAGLACFMRGKKPEEIADHMQRVAISVTDELKFAAQYKDAIEEECIITFVDPESTARETLRKLINWHVMVSLDPRVSSAARDLMSRGEAIERVASEMKIRSVMAKATKDVEESDKAWKEVVEELERQVAELTSRNAQEEHGAAIASTSRGAKTTVAAIDGNTPSCATEPSPGSACETGTSAQPTPEQDGPTTTRPVVSDGATVYVVMAHRGGDVENHTYCAAVCSSLSQAKTSADEHEQYRGGKYACSILEVPVGMFSEDASDFVEVRKATPIPGWKTALQRVLDDRERDRRAETAERELAALQAAVGWLFDYGPLCISAKDNRTIYFNSEDAVPEPHAEAIRRAVE